MSESEPDDAIGKLVWMQKRACIVTIECNEHRVNYRTVAEELEIEQLIDRDFIDDYGDVEDAKAIAAECVKQGQLVTMRCYTATPIGSYVVRHYDVERAIHIMFEIVKRELLTSPFKEKAKA